MTANEKYKNYLIESKHYEYRYRTQVIALILSLFDEYKDKVKNVFLVSSGTLASYKTKVALGIKLKSLREKELTKIADALTKELKKFARVRLDLEYKKLRSVIKEYELKNRLRTPDSIEQSVFKKVEFDDGSVYTLKSFLKDIDNRNKLETRRLLNYGYRYAEKPNALEAGIDAAYQPNRRQYESIITTMIAFVSATVVSQLYGNNKTMLSGYQLVAVLDAKTTDICLNLNDRVWYYGHPELSTLPGEIFPPFHFGCRTIAVPIIKSADELGVVNEELTGKPVKEQSYNEWLKGQAPALQRDILGTTRYGLYKDGKVSIDAFYSADGRKITLDQLKQKVSDI